MDPYRSKHVQNNTPFSFLRLRRFLIVLVINGGQLIGLHGIKYDINEDIIKLRLPSNMGHASLIYRLVFTDRSFVAIHSGMTILYALHKLGRGLF